MSQRQSTARPEPHFENGNFIASIPIPDPRPIDAYSHIDIIQSILKINKNPLESMGEDGYKNDVTQFSFFNNSFTYINSPEAIQHCFITNRENYRFQKIRQRILRPIIRDGLIAAEGPEWSHARRIISPMFTPRNVKSFAAIMQKTSERVMDDLLGKDTPTLMAPYFSSLTYLILSDTLFSGEIEADEAKMLKDVAIILERMGRPGVFDLMGAPKWVPRLTNRKGLKAVREIRTMIAHLTAKRRSDKVAGRPLADDFLTRLLSIGDDGETHPFTSEQIEDHILTFIGAGHETTARALCWMVYLLSQDHSRRERLEAEVDALDIKTIPPENWYDKLPYSAACFEEAMRLFPPAPFIAREAVSPDNIGGYTVPTGGVVMINTWQLHRHLKYWDQPWAFVPERFLPEHRHKINKFQYLPFGVGERVCIGQKFALQEAVILIALLLRRYRFKYAGQTPPWPKMRITIKPENNMPMYITRRT